MSLESLKHYGQIVQEAASYTQETRRIPDPYFFYFDEIQRKLTPPGSSVPIENFIRKSTYIDILEAEAFEKIQNMVGEHQSGLIIWLSPPTNVYHDSKTTKIIIGEIQTEIDNSAVTSPTKMILNRAIILNWSLTESIQFARELTGNYYSECQLRKTPFYKPANESQIVNRLLLSRTDQMKMIESGYDIETKSESLAKIDSLGNTINVYRNDTSAFEERLYAAIKSKGLVGNFRPRCELNAFALLGGSGISTGESFDCPKCRNPIPSGRGIEVCPSCGAKKSDYKKCD